MYMKFLRMSGKSLRMSGKFLRMRGKSLRMSIKHLRMRGFSLRISGRPLRRRRIALRKPQDPMRIPTGPPHTRRQMPDNCYPSLPSCSSLPRHPAGFIFSTRSSNLFAVRRVSP